MTRDETSKIHPHYLVAAGAADVILFVVMVADFDAAKGFATGSLGGRGTIDIIIIMFISILINTHDGTKTDTYHLYKHS